MSLLQPRQPFAVLDESRLQALGSIKNRQNNVFNDIASPTKSPLSATGKRRQDFDNTSDSENVNPIILASPSKKAKNYDGTPVLKASKFILSDKFSYSAPNTVVKRSSLAIDVPPPTSSTPISHSRGSPKLKSRTSLLSKRRSSTPFRRINPPNTASPLPFSIDAALSGTISSYTPPAAPLQAPSPILNTTEFVAPVPKPAVEASSSSKSVPKGWFFQIHEDTPDQEASNMLQHSASVLDISSDDDAATSRLKDAMEKGKENIPPPDWSGPTRGPRTRNSRDDVVGHRGIKCPKKAAKFAADGAAKDDEMVEDRRALGELDVTAFWDDEDLEADTEVEGDDDAEVISKFLASIEESKEAVSAEPGQAPSSPHDNKETT